MTLTLPSSETEQGYPLSYNAAFVEILALSVFPNDATARCIHCRHQTNNLTTTVCRSYAAAAIICCLTGRVTTILTYRC